MFCSLLESKERLYLAFGRQIEFIIEDLCKKEKMFSLVIIMHTFQINLNFILSFSMIYRHDLWPDTAHLSFFPLYCTNYIL